MRKLVYSMGVSLDGYIAGPAGEIDWSAPGEELHRFHNQQARETGAELYGRRLYEEMRFWETADRQQTVEHVLEFARIWKATPKFVFSSTLDEVQGDATHRTAGSGSSSSRRARFRGRWSTSAYAARRNP